MPTADTGRILAGRYRLISQLRVGGMGITYRAWDDVNAVPVVVKMPRQDAQSDKEALQEALRRFAREIDAMLKLSHDHIVPITDHGEENGCPYVVMRFLPGGSLADHRRRDDDGKPLANPVGMLHFWLPAVANALDFIHEKGVLHRDIKPGNIFFDGFWNAFLGDFGIAKVVDSSAGLAKEKTITAPMIAIGTPEYMAPELFSPKGKPDGRADQYALAVTVYEMLCGVKPFNGAKDHIVVEHSWTPVQPLQNMGLGIPMRLCVAVERALAKTPPERFTTCAEFARAALRDVPLLPSEPDIARLMCPSCAKILRMPTSADGQWGKCPKCKVAMRVAPGLSALWLRNEEFSNSDTDGDASKDDDSTESSEKPKGLFLKVPAVVGWESRKARELSQKLMAIPPWAWLAAFIAGAAMLFAGWINPLPPDENIENKIKKINDELIDAQIASHEKAIASVRDIQGDLDKSDVERHKHMRNWEMELDIRLDSLRDLKGGDAGVLKKLEEEFEVVGKGEWWWLEKANPRRGERWYRLDTGKNRWEDTFNDENGKPWVDPQFSATYEILGLDKADQDIILVKMIYPPKGAEPGDQAILRFSRKTREIDSPWGWYAEPKKKAD